MKIRRGLRVENQFDHEHELGPGFATVNYRWRVFRFRRDVTHFSSERFFDAVHFHLGGFAVLNRADERFGDKRAHLDVLRWQQDDDWLSRCHPFALAKESVVNQAGLRRILLLLIETPIGLIQSILVLISGGTGAVQILGSGNAGAEKFFLSGKLGFGQNESRFDLITCRFFSGFIQLEKRLARRDLLAALHRKCFQLPGKRRSNINKFAFDITLKPVLRSFAATREDNQRDDNCGRAHQIVQPAHALLPFGVSAPSRTIFKIPAKPSFGTIPSSSIFGGFMIDWIMASKISIISLTGTSLRTMPARWPSRKSFRK